MLKQHVVPVHVEKYLDALPPETRDMPVNLYHTNSYLIINAGLPRCVPDHVHIFVAPARMASSAARLSCHKGIGRTILPSPTLPMDCSPSQFPRRRGLNICVRCTRHKQQGEVQSSACACRNWLKLPTPQNSLSKLYKPLCLYQIRLKIAHTCRQMDIHYSYLFIR